MPTPATPRRVRATKAALSTNGAVPTTAPVADVVCPGAPPRRASNTVSAHQTHGAVTPLNGTISTLDQLMNRGRTVVKGSIESFGTLDQYRAHLKTLALHELHRHAREEARIVPIDDRERLIRRLETAWTTTASKFPGRTNVSTVPARVPFTKAQMDAQAAIKSQLLKE